MFFDLKVQDYRTAYPQLVAKSTGVIVCLLLVWFMLVGMLMQLQGAKQFMIQLLRWESVYKP